ncbi:MAG: hypothetical protein HRT43_06555 [Campylobacteraceae bacterium]|nr:hypothetical protein [Campylobacteraceae bacterium]
MEDFNEAVEKLDLTHYVYLPNKRLFKFKKKVVQQNTFLAEEIVDIMETIQNHSYCCEIDRFHNIMLI